MNPQRASVQWGTHQVQGLQAPGVTKFGWVRFAWGQGGEGNGFETSGAITSLSNTQKRSGAADPFEAGSEEEVMQACKM